MERPAGYRANITKDRDLYGDDAKKYGWQDGTTKYRVSIINPAGKSVSFNYFTGPAITERPVFEDVVGAAISDATFYENAPTLQEFAAESGMPLDGPEEFKAARKTFDACKSMSERLRALLGDDFDALQELTQDR
jgi:hypothetical protein